MRHLSAPECIQFPILFLDVFSLVLGPVNIKLHFNSSQSFSTFIRLENTLQLRCCCILEPLPSMESMKAMESMGQRRKYRIRNSLLAVTDCPYVQLLQDEIAAYAAASELQCILKANK
ncbi:MAG: hypothetical protein D3907_04035, partial [Candidatus Electrothrix sp. AUS3]|nr:hypothetical protein [Candidatus Electrothrix gigas]